MKSKKTVKPASKKSQKAKNARKGAGRRASKRASKSARKSAAQRTPATKRRAKTATPAGARQPGDLFDPVATYAEAAASALGLPLEPAWRDNVAFNLRLILSHASLVDEFPLADETEPAPVYRA